MARNAGIPPRWVCCVTGTDGASRFLVVARNITQRKRIETAEREQRVLAEALQDVALALNSTLNLEEIWVRILSNVVRVVPADAAAILLVEEGKARVVGERGYSERGMDVDMVGHEIEVCVLEPAAAHDRDTAALLDRRCADSVRAGQS